MSSGGQILRLRGHKDSICCLAVSFDNRYLASGSEDGCIVIHDVAAAVLANEARNGNSGATAATGAPAFVWCGDGAAAAATPAAAAEDDKGSGDGSEPEAVTALAFDPRSSSNSGNVLYAAVGATLLRFELPRRNAAADAEAGSTGGGPVTLTPGASAPANASGDEVNALAVHHRGTHLAAADDAGDVAVFDVSRGSFTALRTLRGAHAPLASAVAFRRHRPWELLTGGLDCRAARWDFARGRPLGAWAVADIGSGGGGEGAGDEGGGGGEAAGMTLRACNPPYVHAIAAPGGAGPAARRLLAAACGDGSVAVFSIEDGAAGGSSSGGGNGSSNSKTGAKAKAAPTAKSSAAEGPLEYVGQPLSLSLRGGHTRAASALCFLSAGGGARYLASGGEDRRLCVWDWQAAAGGGGAQRPTAVTAPAAAAADGGKAPAPALVLDDGPAPRRGGDGGGAPAPQPWAHAHGRKINALASVAVRAPATGQQQQQQQQQQHVVAEYLCVADTSRLITLYPVQVRAGE